MKDVQISVGKVGVIVPWIFFISNAINNVLILTQENKDTYEMMVSNYRSCILLSVALATTIGFLLIKFSSSDTVVSCGMCFVYLGVCSTVVAVAYNYTQHDFRDQNLGSGFPFTLDFINFLIHLFFTMFGALFRPGYVKITLLTSLITICSESIID